VAGRRVASLLLPALAVLVALLFFPLLLVADESFRVFTPGRVGSVEGAHLTLQNYADLLGSAYAGYFGDTFRMGLTASFIAVVLATPIAYRVARTPRPARRRTWIAFLVAMLFLSIMVRVYAIALAFGPAGFGRDLAALLGVGMNSRSYVEFAVVAGLLHCLIPMAALALLAPMQNLNPRLIEAAQALGSPVWKAHAVITLPLSARGILSAFMLCLTFCLSAFVIPLVLGKGRILFVSNLVYNRFGEVGNYPGGAAIAIVLLLLSLTFVYLVAQITNRRWS
jgi:ABC-type spermidine/putrescine transport system permease subunit I